MSHSSQPTIDSPPARGVHRLAVLTVCLVWPLIWVGGLVTTYDAGMAVPDWPGTYGYNLFLYPYKTWLLGPFDLFIEHGHRLLGAVVGFVAIGMLVAAFSSEPRRWVRLMSVAILVAVIAQGLLGGMRVVLGDRTLAMVHGCFGPAFFALASAFCVVTSRWWWKLSQSDAGGDVGKSSLSAMPTTALSSRVARLPIGRGTIVLGIGLIVFSYVQLVLGAQLRHVQPMTRPGIFAMTIMLHVMTAFILWAWSAIAAFRLRRCGDLTLSRPALALVALVGLQILLGVGTWVVNYGWPTILAWVPVSTDFLLRAKGFADSIVVTAHVATGSLILAVSAVLTARLLRTRWIQRREVESRVERREEISSAIPNTFTAAPVNSIPETVTT